MVGLQRQLDVMRNGDTLVPNTTQTANDRKI